MTAGGEDGVEDDDPWAADRKRVSMCISCTPLESTYENVEAAVLAVTWPERHLRWHASRRVVVDTSNASWVAEFTASLLAHGGDESTLCARIASLTEEGLVADVELVVSAPCHIPFISLTPEQVTVDFDRMTTTATGEPAKDFFLRCGVVTSQNALLDENLIAALRACSERRIAEVEGAIAAHYPGIHLGSDRFAFLEMGSRGAHRFDLLFDDADPDDALLFHVAKTAPWVTLMNHILPPPQSLTFAPTTPSLTSSVSREETQPEVGWRCAVSVVYSRPGAGEQEWHADGKHLGPEADFSGNGAAAPYAVCVFVPLVDLNHILGFTQMWMGSHVTGT